MLSRQTSWTITTLFASIVVIIMSPSLSAALSVQEFGARAFIQKSLAAPFSVASVLSFFYGADFHAQDAGAAEQTRQYMRRGTCCHNGVHQLWYFGGPEYDELCQAFRETVRAAGRNEFLTHPANQNSNNNNNSFLSEVDGQVAQMLLCDQLSRNIFRGTTEAFAYEDAALQACRTLTQVVLTTDDETNSDKTCHLAGEVYPPYLSFMITAFMHSESVADHELGLQLLDYAEKTTPTTSSDDDDNHYKHLTALWKSQRQYTVDHKAVVDRFGRYPHRNKAKGRANTPDEEAWLADTDNLPAWAKSQM